MSATRKLDILTLLGGILAVAAIVIPMAFSRPPIDPTDMGREAALRAMPDNDVRADLAVLSEWPWGEAAASQVKKTWGGVGLKPGTDLQAYERQRQEHTAAALAQAIRRFPDSARIQFREGTLGNDPKKRIAALRNAADLDKENACPLYALAGEYAAAGKHDQALRLLSQGNRRPRVDWYPIPYGTHSGGALSDMLIASANSNAQLPAIMYVRQTARQLIGYADKLRASGHNQQALAVMDQIRGMGWRLIRQDQANLLDMLIGVAITKIAEKPETQIYAETGNKAGQLRIERDEREFIRLGAGMRAYTGQSMEKLVNSFARFTAFGIPVAAAGAVASVLTLLSLIWWGILALRSRKQAPSDFHEETARKAFAQRRLASMWTAVLVIVVGSTVVLVRTASLGPVAVGVIQAIGAVVCAVSAVVVLGWANKAYGRRYQQVAESYGETMPRPWKGYPIADKRERQRRLTGVMGGVVVGLALWGVILSAYMKTAMHAYPWQMERATAGMYQEETRYVHDLVAGKIKVPEKYIREVEQQQRKRDAERKK